MQANNEMNWGVLLTTAQFPGLSQRDVMTDVLAYASEAERLGYDAGWLLEHHFTRFGLCTDPLTRAAFVLGRTKLFDPGRALPNSRFHLERKEAAMARSDWSPDEIVARMLATNRASSALGDRTSLLFHLLVPGG